MLPEKYSLFDDFFHNSLFSNYENKRMKTDIIEKENMYDITIDLPGFSKEDIKMSLENGYLTIFASIEEENDTEKQQYVKKERVYGACSRSFYIGEQIKEEDITASYKNGVLKISIPKKKQEVAKEAKKYIQIKD